MLTLWLATGFIAASDAGTETVESGAQFGPIHRLRRKKRNRYEKKRTLKDAIEDAFQELERIATRAQVATEAQARDAVDSEALIQAAGDAAYKAAYEAAMAKALADEKAEAERQAAKVAEARTAIEAAFAKAEHERQAREAAAVAEAMQTAFAEAKAAASAAYARFIELEKQNDDEEDAMMALMIVLEAA